MYFFFVFSGAVLAILVYFIAILPLHLNSDFYAMLTGLWIPVNDQ